MDRERSQRRLRLLVVSNLYPPRFLGGYELGCAEIVDGLRRRGHEITVLTSRHGVEAPRIEGHVHRLLEFRPNSAPGSRVGGFRRAWGDQRWLRRTIEAVQPDLLFAFSFYGLSTALLLTAQTLGCRIAYAFSAEWLEPGFSGDGWLSFWHGEAGAPWKRRLKPLVRRAVETAVPTGLVPLDFSHAFFTSRRLREIYLTKGFPVQGAEVIYWGVDPRRFQPTEGPTGADAVRLLFAGRVAKEKGLHTAIDALALLRPDADAPRVRLTVAGPAQDAEYLAAIHRRVDACGLRAQVDFAGAVGRDAMPSLYRDHDVFLLPSVWEEPFSIGLLEAMASGLAVVGTPTGGSREILRDQENALTFPPENGPELARQVRRLYEPALRARLGREARHDVQARFTLEGMIDRVEAFLSSVARANARRGEGAERVW
jgi:glycosyltransferase involved in cell wall biosynthesis